MNGFFWTFLGGAIITPTLKLGYIDQHLLHLPLELSLHDYINQTLSIEDQKKTSMLVSTGFPVVSHRTQLKSLSQGQRARVAFLTLHLLQPNFYVMDEPTNHLDIAGQEQLELEILKMAPLQWWFHMIEFSPKNWNQILRNKR